jgi:hypothetical protein
VFESSDRLQDDVLTLMEAILDLGHGRYAALVEKTGVILDTPEPDDGRATALRKVIDERAPAILKLAAALAADTEEDAFADWTEDEFLVAVLNERVALVVACPDAETLKAGSEPPLKALVDRLLRWKPAYRLDPQGRGIFVGRPRLDVIVVGSHGGGDEAA